MQVGLPLLYSFRRCPFAMRARLALAISSQVCVHREIKLRARPPELLAVSPKATVPVLVIPDGKILEESLDIMLWTLTNHDPAGWLNLAEEQMAEARRLIAHNDGDFKFHLDRYKYAGRQPGEAPEVHRAEASKFLTKLDQRLTKNAFLFGPDACLADMAILPFVRQFAFADRDWFDEQPWNALRNWLDTFIASPLFTSIMTKHEVWNVDSAPLVVDWTSSP
ncbi:MAG: glutathione S-transferase [Planctomycetota bacterium]|jgi:glutathione S-transferase